jgi:hypothetical protein
MLVSSNPKEYLVDASARLQCSLLSLVLSPNSRWLSKALATKNINVLPFIVLLCWGTHGTRTKTYEN